MNKKIYEDDIKYTLLRHYIIDGHVKNCYSRFSYSGADNIPENAAVILAPNHCNSLMDALVVLGGTNQKMVFGARADIFRKPLIAKLMTFFKILPMARMRDGARSVLANYEITEKIVEVIGNKVLFCMFAEGTHRMMHSMLPVKKGILRAATEAYNKFGDKLPIYIVPVGLEYGDYTEYHSTCYINFGKAINVTEVFDSIEAENENQLYEPLREILAEKIKNQITYIKDDELYQSKWALLKALRQNENGYCFLNRCKDPKKTLEGNQNTIRQIEVALSEQPDLVTQLLKDAETFDRDRKKAGISTYSFASKKLPVNICIRGFLHLLSLPLYLFATITAAPAIIASSLIKKKVKDKAFHNTVHFGAKVVGTPISLLLSLVIFLLTMPHWAIALGLSAATIFSYNFFYDWNYSFRRLISDIRLHCNKGLKRQFKQLCQQFQSISK